MGQYLLQGGDLIDQIAISHCQWKSERSSGVKKGGYLEFDATTKLEARMKSQA